MLSSYQVKKMKNREEVKAQVDDVVLEIAGVEQTRLLDDACIKEDLLIDSITFVKILIELEDIYDCEFGMENLTLEGTLTYGRFIDLILEKFNKDK